MKYNYCWHFDFCQEMNEKSIKIIFTCYCVRMEKKQNVTDTKY